MSLQAALPWTNSQQASATIGNTTKVWAASKDGVAIPTSVTVSVDQRSRFSRLSPYHWLKFSTTSVTDNEIYSTKLITDSNVTSLDQSFTTTDSNDRFMKEKVSSKLLSCDESDVHFYNRMLFLITVLPKKHPTT